MEQATKTAIIATLQFVKQQAIYLQRQHKWISAVSDSIVAGGDLAQSLKSHPYFDLGREASLRNFEDTPRHIDVLIAQIQEL